MDKIDRYSNNFDFLRLAAALMVIVFTTYGLLGTPTHDPLLQFTKGVFTLGSLGVTVFFIISGFLIAKSWDQRQNVFRFVWARFLRLVPALAGVALFTVFIIGPLTTHKSIPDYFTSGMTWGYFSIVTVFFPAYNLPGVFTQNSSTLVNGSLWSLPVEASMYLVVLIVGALGIFSKKRLISAVTLSATAIYLFLIIQMAQAATAHTTPGLIVPAQYYSFVLSLIFPFFFLLGAVYYLNRDIVRFDFRLVLLAAFAWALSSWSYELLLLASFVCLPYIVLGTAFTGIPYLDRMGKKADISYGLYIFHYPVMQTLVNFLALDYLTLFIATLSITVPLAWLSWHLIESRALSLKDINFKNVLLRQIGPFRPSDRL